MNFTIFYDGKCPLCVAEMVKLDRLNHRGQLQFVNIHELNDYPQYQSISFKQANRILHGITDDGEVLLGLDVTYQAWKSVGKGHWVAPLKWKWLRRLADPLYLYFARNRYDISKRLTGQDRCEEQCSWKK